MRTTVDIDNDVLEIARSLARYRNQSLGKVISELCRKNLQSEPGQTVRNGVRVLSRGDKPVSVTLGLVNKLRDETV